MEIIKEGSASITLCKDVFYNPYMRVSRDISAKAFKLINKEHNIKLLDAFTATGVRGIRYALESKCNVSFLDIDQKAIECCKKNLELNNINAEVINSDFNKFIINNINFNAVELDPFGSSIPYLWPCIYSLSSKKSSLISITNTDLQVLCGANKKAALKYYGAKIEKSYYCHEIAIRVLLKKLAEIAIEHNMGIKPLLSFYHRHSIKVICQLKRGDKHAIESLNNINMINNIGPLWTGNIKDKEFVNGLDVENLKEDSKNIINTLKQELDGLFFYSTDEISKTLKSNPLKTSLIINMLKEHGYKASFTHFSTKGFKTDAKLEDVIKIIKVNNKGQVKN